MPRLAAVTLALALSCAAAASAQGPGNRWIQDRAPLNIAHQGGEDEFPSNTMYAFRRAASSPRSTASTSSSHASTSRPA